MADRGIDISGHASKTLDRVMQEPWDHVITVCDDANEHCPFLPGTFARLPRALAASSPAA